MKTFLFIFGLIALMFLVDLVVPFVSPILGPLVVIGMVIGLSYFVLAMARR
jgi:sorbitol-specific phosphotransferase system component IIBC